MPQNYERAKRRALGLGRVGDICPASAPPGSRSSRCAPQCQHGVHVSPSSLFLKIQAVNLGWHRPEVISGDGATHKKVKIKIRNAEPHPGVLLCEPRLP